MAGLFDYFDPYMGPDLTPQEAKALQVKATGAVNPNIPLEGEVMPREAAGKPAGLLGSDPVATQQQSRVGPQQGRTFYTNSAGQTGTQVPKGSGTAGLYDDVAEAVKKGGTKGLLGRIGAAIASPAATGLQALTYSSDAGDASDELSPAQREANNPGEQADAAAYAQRVQANAKQAAQPPLQGAGLLMAGQPQQAPAAAPTADVPVSPQEQKAKQLVQAHAQEKQRQSIESNVLDGLKSNKLSRVKAAEAVVQADTQRKGLDLTPDEKKAAVAQEVSSMRNMDNGSLAKYLSFAVMGLGFLAGGTSEANGQAFASNFRSGYDRAISREQAQRKLDYQMRKDSVEQDYKERTLNNTVRDTDSKIGDRKQSQALGRDKLDWTKTYQGSVLDQGDRRLDQGDRRLGQGDVANGIAQQRVGIAADGNNIARERLGIAKSRADAQNKKDAASTAKLEKFDVPNLSQKDGIAAVQGYYSDKGQNVTEGAAATISDQLIRLRQQYPNVPTEKLIEYAQKKSNVKLKERTWPFSDRNEIDNGED